VRAAVLNSGGTAWAFASHAEHLSRLFHLPISSEPAGRNYVLGWEGPDTISSFIPLDAMRAAADKRLLAERFAAAGVSVPRTLLLESVEVVHRLLETDHGVQWVLKWPTGCGAAGHRILGPETVIAEDWPRPLVVQEFVRLAVPEVYRLYVVAGETFGWNVRRFPPGSSVSPFVAHARGARYEEAGPVPEEAEHQARLAMASVGILDSFGCADLMRNERGEWLVLEVNTDGLSLHVDRDINPGDIAAELDARLGAAFDAWIEG